MSSLVFHLIAHTHWDREWYLPRAALHARLVPALDDLVTRLTADPAYRSFLLDGHDIVGLTAGASTPEELVQAVVARLAAVGYGELAEVEVAREDVHFRLPREVVAT